MSKHASNTKKIIARNSRVRSENCFLMSAIA